MSKSQANNSAFLFPQQALTFDPDAFDTAIESQGVRLVHWRGMRCPVGMTDRYDSRRPHDDHSGCSNGFIYTEAGTVQALFTSVTNNRDANDIGVLDGSTVQVTTPRFYDDTEAREGSEIQVVPFDRFYLNEESVTVEHWQLVEHHITGKDKVSFPVVEVVDLMDAKGKRYQQNQQFDLVQGQIVWRDSLGPGFDAEANKGVIYTVRYRYRPYWYCKAVNHQVRVGQVETIEERKIIRFPQAFTLVREHVFEKQDNDPESVDSDSPRQVKGPADGPYGPR